jgi:hypothetical protein
VAQGVPGRLRPQIFSTFGTTTVVDPQPNAPAAFTPGEIPGTHFQRLSQPQGTWFCRKEPGKKSPVTPPGIDPGTVRLVSQRPLLNIGRLDLSETHHIFNFDYNKKLRVSTPNLGSSSGAYFTNLLQRSGF